MLSPVLAATLTVTVAGGGMALAADGDGGGEDHLTLARSCVVQPEEEGMPTLAKEWALESETVSCVLLWELDDEALYTVEEVRESFPEVPVEELMDFEHFAVVTCAGGGATVTGVEAVGLGEATELPQADADRLGQACMTHSGAPAGQRAGWGWTGAATAGTPNGGWGDTPTADGTTCSSPVENPRAQLAGGTLDDLNQPANKAKEELSKEFGGWFGGAAVGGIAGGGASGVPKGVIAGATGKGIDLIVNREEAAAKVGQYMWDQAIYFADQAAEYAEQAAIDAEYAAGQAESAYRTNPNPTTEAAAAAARSAADAARAAANRASGAAAATRAGFKDAGKNLEETKKAADEAAQKKKEAETEAKKAEEGASGSASPQPKPSASPSASASGKPVPENDSSIKTCDELRHFIADCEAKGWNSYECQDFLWKLWGCGGDMTVINPGEEGYKCAGGDERVDPETVREALTAECEKLAKPAPGEDPCAGLTRLEHGIDTSGLDKVGGCDPTIAFTEPGGCQVQPTAMLEVKEFCPAAAPATPVGGCASPKSDGVTEPLPIIEAFGSHDTPLMYAANGLRTPLTNLMHAQVDNGNGYHPTYILMGLTAVDVAR